MTPEQFADLIKVLKDIDNDLVMISGGIFIISFFIMMKK